MSAPALLSLLAYVLQGTVILAAGALFLGLLRARDPSFRLACLESLWWSSLVLPLVFPLLPRLRPPVLAPAGGSLATTFADVTARLPAAVPRGASAWPSCSGCLRSFSWPAWPWGSST